MKTKRLILALTTWTVVIVMSLHSCQTDSGYDKQATKAKTNPITVVLVVPNLS